MNTDTGKALGILEVLIKNITSGYLTVSVTCNLRMNEVSEWSQRQGTRREWINKLW